jgi:hypothetical protein
VQIKNFGKFPADNLTLSTRFTTTTTNEKTLSEPVILQILQANDDFKQEELFPIGNEDISKLANAEAFFKVFIHLEYHDGLTDTKFNTDYCFTHVGGGFTNITKPGEYVLGLFPCDSDYVKEYLAKRRNLP